MSNEQPENPSLSQGADQDFTASEPAIVPGTKKGSGNKVIVIFALVAVVAVVAYYGMRAMKRPPVVQAPAAQIHTPAATPPSVGLSEPGPANSPSDGVPVVEPAPPAGAPVDPTADALAALGAQPAGPEVAPAAGPLDVAPDATAAPGPAAAPVEPPVPSSPPPSTPAPPSTPEETGMTQDLAGQVGQAVTQALRPIEKRLDSIDSRLTVVEGRAPAPAKSSGIKSSSSKPRAHKPRSSSRPVVRATPKPSAPANRIEIIDAPAPVVSAPLAAQAPAVGASTRECKLGAVLAGRAWIKRQDGSFDSYLVGDTLPDGKVITEITPERGIVVNGRTWSCN